MNVSSFNLALLGGRSASPLSQLARISSAARFGRLKAPAPGDMGLPGLKLHPLKGGRSGTWAVSVSGNWRITFRFSGKDAVDVEYEDYHRGGA